MGKNKAANKKQSDLPVRAWLMLCCACIFIMVLLGGFTRLTDSGLSIMKWEPLSGIIPPMSAESWESYFTEYQKIPEYHLQNKGMSLEEFKGIFWLEYLHRLMARATGFIFLLPFLYFAYQRHIDKQTAIKFGGIFILGAVQGIIGWWMVSSGFAKRTDVSQYRLAIHLCGAFLIFALIYWAYMDIKYKSTRWHKSGLALYSKIVCGAVFFMIILGAFVAGTDAGFTYNTFPLMDGRLVPKGLYSLSPLWRNHFENITMIQFQHRCFAYIVAGSVFVLAYKLVMRNFNNVNVAIVMVSAVIFQVMLGIATLYSFGSYADYQPASHAYNKVLYLPVIIAAAHQLNALFLFAVSLKAVHRLGRETQKP